jgi:hypothetical protein
MAFGKAFGSALVLYALLNFGLSIVTLAVAAPNSLAAYFTLSNIYIIIASLFIPAVVSPAFGFQLIAGITVGGASWMLPLFTAIQFILPPLLSALVAGKLAEEPKSAFGAWFLIPVIFAVIVLVLAQFITAFQTELMGTLVIQFTGEIIALITGITSATGVTFLALDCILMGVVNGIMWSGLACVVTGP